MPVASAEFCAEAFTSGWVQHFGLQDQATSDTRLTFTGQLLMQICQNLVIITKFSPPYRPQSVGHVERLHRDIKVGLKAALTEIEDKLGEELERQGRSNPVKEKATQPPRQVDMGTTPPRRSRPRPLHAALHLWEICPILLTAIMSMEKYHFPT